MKSFLLNAITKLLLTAFIVITPVCVFALLQYYVFFKVMGLFLDTMGYEYYFIKDVALNILIAFMLTFAIVKKRKKLDSERKRPISDKNWLMVSIIMGVITVGVNMFIGIVFRYINTYTLDNSLTELREIANNLQTFIGLVQIIAFLYSYNLTKKYIAHKYKHLRLKNYLFFVINYLLYIISLSFTYFIIVLVL